MPGILLKKANMAQRMPKYTDISIINNMAQLLPNTGIFIINNMTQRMPNIIIYKYATTQRMPNILV